MCAFLLHKSPSPPLWKTRHSKQLQNHWRCNWKHCKCWKQNSKYNCEEADPVADDSRGSCNASGCHILVILQLFFKVGYVHFCQSYRSTRYSRNPVIATVKIFFTHTHTHTIIDLEIIWFDLCLPIGSVYLATFADKAKCRLAVLPQNQYFWMSWGLDLVILKLFI